MVQRIVAFAQGILPNTNLARSTILAMAVQLTVLSPTPVVYESPPIRPAFVRESDDTKIREE